MPDISTYLQLGGTVVTVVLFLQYLRYLVGIQEKKDDKFTEALFEVAKELSTSKYAYEKTAKSNELAATEIRRLGEIITKRRDRK